MHGLLLGSFLPLDWPLLLTVPATLGVLVHFLLRRPVTVCPELMLGADGLWTVPANGLDRAEAGPRTRYTRYWVRLDLVGAAGSLVLVLTWDQLDSDAWRRLQAALRRATPAQRTDNPKDRPAVLR